MTLEFISKRIKTAIKIPNVQLLTREMVMFILQTNSYKCPRPKCSFLLFICTTAYMKQFAPLWSILTWDFLKESQQWKRSVSMLNIKVPNISFQWWKAHVRGTGDLRLRTIDTRLMYLLLPEHCSAVLEHLAVMNRHKESGAEKPLPWKWNLVFLLSFAWLDESSEETKDTEGVGESMQFGLPKGDAHEEAEWK